MQTSVAAGTRSHNVQLLHQQIVQLKSQQQKLEQENAKKWKVQQDVNLSYLRAIAKLEKKFRDLVPERTPKRRAHQQQKLPAVFEKPPGGARRKRTRESLSPIQVDVPVQPEKRQACAGKPLSQRQLLALTSTGLTEGMAQIQVEASVVQAVPAVQAASTVHAAPPVQAAAVVQTPARPRGKRQHPARRPSSRR